ncbi:unnamed protein product [Rotaria sp. Silwood1]|nr:unnamed protein product [Rotaria sp. Silwood1]CAF1550823.1 unnamed protein product [Rotaria sp. Silwood1]
MGVLFIMKIDPSRVSTSSTPYAIIDGLSALPQEKEILFSMHTVFNVVDVKQATANNQIWEVQLTLTNDTDPQLASLTRQMREETQGSTAWRRMAMLMYKLGDFSQAEELYTELLETCCCNIETALIYHNLGSMKDAQGNYAEAIKYYEKSLGIKQKTMPQGHTSFANTYQQLGNAYQNMGDYSKALHFLFNEPFKEY